MRLLHVAVLAAAGLLLNSCGEEDESGACHGNMDGTYFRLRVANTFPDSGTIDVRVNGRFIGKVPEPTQSAGGELVPGEARLGEFPVCDKTVINADGSQLDSQRLCMTPGFLAPDCRQLRQDFCWVDVIFFSPQNPPDPEVIALSQPNCMDLVKPVPECDPPYTTDGNGNQVPKPGCFPCAEGVLSPC